MSKKTKRKNKNSWELLPANSGISWRKRVTRTNMNHNIHSMKKMSSRTILTLILMSTMMTPCITNTILIMRLQMSPRTMLTLTLMRIQTNFKTMKTLAGVMNWMNPMRKPTPLSRMSIRIPEFPYPKGLFTTQRINP